MSPGWRDDRREFGLDAPEHEPTEDEQFAAWLEAQAEQMAAADADEAP